MSTSDGADGVLEGETRSEYRYEYSRDERPSQAVVASVAKATGRPTVPNEDTGGDDGADALPPLYEVIDPDALDALVPPEDDHGTNFLLTFTYDDYTVTVEKRTVTVTTSG